MIKTVLLILLTYSLAEKYYFNRKDKFIAYIFMASSLAWTIILIYEFILFVLSK